MIQEHKTRKPTPSHGVNSVGSSRFCVHYNAIVNVGRGKNRLRYMSKTTEFGVSRHPASAILPMFYAKQMLATFKHSL